MQAAAQQVAADQATASDAFFSDVDAVCNNAAHYLAELSKQVGALVGACTTVAGLASGCSESPPQPPQLPSHLLHRPPPHAPQADEADRHKLRTAALKLRLAQLARERRAREAADAAALEAKQRELDRLLAQERALLGPAASGDPARPGTVASPVSRTGSARRHLASVLLHLC